MRGFARSARLLALALAALCAAYLAALFAIAGGKTNLNVAYFSGDDHIMNWLNFRHAFLEAQYPLSGFRVGVAPMYFPDMLGLFSIYRLGVHPIAANLIMPVIFCAISVGGWIAVCKHLYGTSANRFAFVILAHALPFLFVAAGPSDVHALGLATFVHYGAWVGVPWLMYLAMLIIDGKGHPARPAIALAMVLAAVAASDLVIVPWFVAPLMLILGFLALPYLGLPFPIRMPEPVGKGRLAMTAAALPCGVLAGILLNKAAPHAPSRNVGQFLSADLQGLANNVVSYSNQLAEIATRNPFSASLWALFTALAAWRVWLVLVPKHQRAFPAAQALFGVPAGASHAAFALYFPIAAALSVAAVILTGNIGTYWVYNNRLGDLRHVIPLICIPLFVGWTLLPWQQAGMLKRAGSASLAAVGCAAAVAAGMAILSYAPLSNFNTFASPFHKCFAATARRLGWQGGIGTYPSNDLIANDAAGVNRFIPVGVHRSPEEGKSLLYLDWGGQNRHSFNGAFQFVVVNGYQGRVYPHTPYDKNSTNCPLSEYYLCYPRRHTALILDEKAALGAFGQPQAVVECHGIGFYHYDPPIRTDYSGVANPDLTRVGNAF